MQKESSGRRVFTAALGIAAAPGSFLEDYISQSWSAADGLPGNTVTSVIQDKQGYIYFGTYGGLVRFDGIEFETLNRHTRSQFDFISARALFQNSAGNFWIGSNDEGLTRVSSDGLNAKTFTTKDGLPNNSIRDICEDSAGNIWVGTSGGIAYITSEDTILRPAGLESYGDEQALVVNMCCDSSGRIWVVSAKTNGIYYCTDFNFVRFDGISSVEDPLVSAVFQDSDGALWFGVAPYYVVKIHNNTETLFDLHSEEQSAVFVNSIFQDKDGNIWMGLDKGIAFFKDAVLDKKSVEYKFSDSSINEIIQDREGNIWLASDRKGIEKFSYSKFKTVPLDTTVNAIAEDSESGLVWMGTDNGLYCFRGLERVQNDITRFCSNVRIRDVGFARNGDLLVSTYAQFGQLRVSKDGKISSWTQEDGLTGNKVRVALESASGDLYVGTTNGLNVIKKNTGRIITYTKSEGLVNDYIMCLYEDSDGRMWCGTDGGGVFVLHNGRIEKTYTTENGLAGNVIFKIERIDPADDTLWFSTGSGLSSFYDGKFFTYKSSNGLGTNDIFQILLDSRGNAWMTSNAGISSTAFSGFKDVAEGKDSVLNVKFFMQDEGLRSGGVTSTSRSMKDSQGRIWFTLIDGFAVYDPAKESGTRVKPLLRIKTITLDNKSFSYDKIRKKDIVVPAEVRRISVNYTGLSYSAPEQVMFSYMLDGFDSDFCDWTPERSVSYTNLKPGSYKFLIKAKNGYDIESDIFQNPVIVKKPFIWQTTWFWVLVSISGVLLITVIVYLITRSKYAHELEIAKGKTDALLRNIFPEHVAVTLSDNPGAVIAEKYRDVSILFSDIVGFTSFSSLCTPEKIVGLLNNLFSKFDERAKKEKIEKIKTIGDAYMAVAFNEDNPLDNSLMCIQFAQGMLNDIREFNKTHGTQLDMRIGINTGDVVAGVIGKTKFIYDIWGDTVNVASRMESTGRPGKIHVTEHTYRLTKNIIRYSDAAIIEVKGKGTMRTYFVM